jgi:hypothetical protein
MTPKKLAKKLRNEEKVNYAYYTTLFITKKLGKGYFGSFGTHYRYFHYFLWEK